MQALLEYFITQSVAHSLMVVVSMVSLESLALVSLILSGMVLMVGLGTLVGSSELSFRYTWLAGIIGCLIGDWISFWLDWRFKKPLHRWLFLKRNKALFDKTEHTLYQHNMFTVLVSRFVGPTRPLVPMVAGMPDLPVAKFITLSIIDYLLWPQLYFLPRILVGATIDIPAGMQSGEFKWLLLVTAVFLWVGGWLYWWLQCSGKVTDRLGHCLSRGRLLWLMPLISAIGVVALVVLIRHPLMPAHIDILYKVVEV